MGWVAHPLTGWVDRSVRPLGWGEAAASMQPSVQHGLLLALVARAVWRLVGVHTEELCERCSARASAVSHVYVSGVGDGSTCKIIGFTF